VRREKSFLNASRDDLDQGQDTQALMTSRLGCSSARPTCCTCGLETAHGLGCSCLCHNWHVTTNYGSLPPAYRYFAS
jgi:hypothetical protein